MKQDLLRDLLAMPDICCIIGDSRAISEGFVNADEVKYEEAGGWATIENGSWHIHFQWEAVRSVRFVEAPSFCLGGKISYGIHYLDAEDQPVVRFTFSKLYDAAGTLDREKHARYEALKARYGR
ncbi:MAG: hypothetical protein HYY96_13415 [Candidatus Tectomicrobia bacterium]|nr:hypothetical protein [Candidatus Tectomicrobia bacterium]